MTGRVEHAAEALRLANLSQHPNAGDPAVGALYISAAQVHATLALVEQRRIANVIALGEQFDFVGEPGTWQQERVLRSDIREALGL